MGGKEGFCSPYPASSTLVSVCAAPFAGRWVFPFLKATKYPQEGRLQECMGTEDVGQPASTELAVLPKLCGLRKQVPGGIQALEVAKGKPSSRVQRRFLWDFLQPRRSLLDCQQAWRKNLTLQRCTWQAKRGNCLQTPAPTFSLSQQLAIWKKVCRCGFCSNKMLHLKAESHFGAFGCSLSRQDEDGFTLDFWTLWNLIINSKGNTDAQKFCRKRSNNWNT